jgi:hypothetical protein
LRFSQHVAARQPEQGRSNAVRALTPLVASLLIVAIPISIVHASDEDNSPSAVSVLATRTAATATAAAIPPSPTAAPPTATATAKPKPTIPPTPTKPPNPTDGLTLVGDGGAAFYAPGYDSGGWDAIISTHMRGGQGSPDTFPYSPQGYYCVHPDFVFGNVLTLQNPETGKTLKCTVADAVAPADQPNWRSHIVIEMSYATFTALGLDQHNHVTVWAMPR